ncbi:MAG: hypothetical protein ACRD1P_04040 [Thermoanaerobaculia bacterium]
MASERKAPRVREYGPTSFRLTATTRNGEDVQVTVRTRVGDRSGLAGTLNLTVDEWRALSVMLAFAESKHGGALQTKVEILADDFVRQVM